MGLRSLFFGRSNGGGKEEGYQPEQQEASQGNEVLRKGVTYDNVQIVTQADNPEEAAELRRVNSLPHHMLLKVRVPAQQDTNQGSHDGYAWDFYLVVKADGYNPTYGEIPQKEAVTKAQLVHLTRSTVPSAGIFTKIVHPQEYPDIFGLPPVEETSYHTRENYEAHWDTHRNDVKPLPMLRYAEPQLVFERRAATERTRFQLEGGLDGPRKLHLQFPGPHGIAKSLFTPVIHGPVNIENIHSPA